MMYHQVSTPIADVGVLPLRLSSPNGINNGGFSNGYSNIDLIIAGLEAIRKDLIVTDLARFFDTYRTMGSYRLVQITLLKKEREVISDTILGFMNRVETDRDNELLSYLKSKAPLTFKWIKI